MMEEFKLLERQKSMKYIICFGSKQLCVFKKSLTGLSVRFKLFIMLHIIVIFFCYKKHGNVSAAPLSVCQQVGVFYSPASILICSVVGTSGIRALSSSCFRNVLDFVFLPKCYPVLCYPVICFITQKNLSDCKIRDLYLNLQCYKEI